MRTAALLAVLSLGLTCQAQQKNAQQNHGDHPHERVKRGDRAMGFAKAKTTHHFRLFKDGGAIEVEANDPKDTESREQIREHLAHIADMFSAGNFESPMFTHGTTPPGVPTMVHLRDQIEYQFEETEKGAKVRIKTVNGQATDAIHAFLLFQIVDHQTGDSPDISGEVQAK
jgi:hypothetical protein